MRVLVTTSAVDSHLNNLVPMAWALRTAGHEVCVASHPNFAESVKSAGLTFVPVGEELTGSKGLENDPDTPFGLGYDIAETRPEVLTLDYVRDTLTAYTQQVCEYMADDAMLKDLVRFARSWKPDLVVWDAHNYAGPVLARVVGAAHVRILPATDHWARMYARYRELAAEHPDDPGPDPLADYLGGKLAAYGAEFDHEMVVGQATLDPMPGCLRYDLPDVDHWPLRHVPYNGPTVIPTWLRKKPRRPRVCLTLGSMRRSLGMHGSVGGEKLLVEDVLEGLSTLDIEVIATLNADQVPPGTRIPENVRLFDFVPLNPLLPTCAAIVHYCGTGTVAASVAHGVPQLGIPGNMWGESLMMGKLEARRAGLVADESRLIEQLKQLLEDPSFREGAAQVQKDMLATPSPHDLVPRLEALTAGNRRPAP
ncbi:nucleotide disphospho-sugar-binding domain-containing protein [Streptomyces spiramenti]|uniref:DUF1205 domain-containing protein n=1 Tax=Streptomyces spiramenti TaxID=2720606 RepID=A0ABX1AK12_9ACTN|nr:nucleotide disphospho-sugar-binding domain-containing protein [Streptomyces spiramenti]NJP64832.1 DUF1205 domain-containing protein [Streptomyces spiramenti]